LAYGISTVAHGVVYPSLIYIVRIEVCVELGRASATMVVRT